MTALLILIVGMFPSVAAGWLLLRAAEGRTAVLANGERWAMGCIIGPTIMTLVALLGNLTSL